MKFITTYKSPNYNLRKKNSNIKFIIIHYTAMYSLKETLKHLCDEKSKVSSHYLISKKGSIYVLVDNNKRAWHAGYSFWKGIKDINSNSIGIELENSGHYLDFEKYNSSQINSLIKLIKYIKLKYNISKKNILGHSDVSPWRKLDPGEKFPWKILEKNKLVYLPKIKKVNIDQKNKSINLTNFKKNLKIIGYKIGINEKKDIIFKNVTKAFQMHFQQNFVTGLPNQETFLLAEKYNKDCID